MGTEERGVVADQTSAELSAPGIDSDGIVVDWEGLAVAVENQLPGSRSFFHRLAGQLVTLQLVDGQDPPPPDDSGAWLSVPARPSRDGYRTMQRFVEQLADGDLKDRLAGALVGRGAFRRFKDQLLDSPDQRQAWFEFKDAEVFGFVSEWFAREGVVPRNPPPSSSSRSRFSAAVRRSAVSLPQMGEVTGHPAGPADPALDWLAAIAPFDRPERVFRPARAALLVIDIQRVFVDPRGSSFLPRSTEACQRLASLAAAFRRTDRPVVFTRHVHRDPRQDGGAMSRWWRSLILEGSWDAEWTDGLRPADGERVITKNRYNAFAFTDLEMVLRSLQIEDLVIGGVMTNLCCETTARDAFVRDFNVFFLGDGTAAAEPALHLASLRNIAYGFGRVLSVAEALRLLGNGQDPRGGTGPREGVDG